MWTTKGKICDLAHKRKRTKNIFPPLQEISEPTSRIGIDRTQAIFASLSPIESNINT